MTDAFTEMMKGLIALPPSRSVTPLADLQPDTGFAWPRFDRRGRWQVSAANPLARVPASNVEPFRLAAIPSDWPADLARQVRAIEAYTGKIDRHHLDEQMAAVSAHRTLIAQRFGAGLAARTLYLALASPGLMHAAAERFFQMDGPNHSQLVERLVFDFLRRQTSPRGFHTPAVDLATGLKLGADYANWLERMPNHSVKIVALVAPFAGVSIDASRLAMRLPGLETRCFIEIGIFVLAQLAAQLPEVMRDMTLVGPADVLRLSNETNSASHSCGIYLDDRSVQIIANQNWLANETISGVLAIL